MQLKPNSSVSIAPIAFAEGGSTLVSLGSVLAMERNPQLIAPLRDYVAERFILPGLVKKHPAEDKDVLALKARDNASLYIKGGVMVGAGFVSHIPIQLAMEGRLTGAGMRDAAIGKGLGLGISLGSIMVLNRLAPHAMPAVQDAIYPLVKPFLPKDERGRDSRQAEEVAKLLILDIPSSVASGLINYMWARGKMR